MIFARNSVQSRFLLLAACALIALIQPAQAADRNADRIQSARSEGDVGASSHDIVQGAHVEGHIAFLKAELGITADQESLWEPVAAAMREDVQNINAAEDQAFAASGPNNAIDYLTQRATFAKLRAQGEERFLEAFRPLYSKLSRAQRRMADDILIPDAPN